ncbi:S41 family peptidase [Aestuariibaculum sediminum]|uniref:Carboxyl-terminal protease n=1 Tax=Aestuariibaculum sediminum TaxID=2770637 RepID=A0A8J6Q717_9FLAO|nr:S41 family peptidase [Aestuariibaculum sediminum]MBD0832278.1 carboxyl-terminal protease [Aestuariibaculum sediminum]
MIKNIKLFIILFTVTFFNTSCFEDNDDNQIAPNAVNDFVWRGMNVFYLYKDGIQDLADDRFSSDPEYSAYLRSFSSPEALFESLIYERETVDKYSWIVDDYIALEQFFSGVSTSNGMEYRLFLQPDSNTNLVGVVRLVLNDSDAETKGLKRGDMFNAVNGIPLTTDNYSNLLSAQTYTLNMAVYNDNNTSETTDDSVDSTNETITLSKLEYSENPIFYTNIYQVNSQNVGYLMYNGFTANYDTQLNNVFANFKANNVQHLILDLRYNSGGSVNSAILLSSMITGQFNGEVFSTEEWNQDFQNAFESENPELLINRFTNNDDGVNLNSLNLDKVYIIATNSSASASELVINSLDPYIDVIHIGDYTTGKYQASTTIYDSENFTREGANPNHTYAMQPLIFKSLNKVGYTDYDNGLTPDILLKESFLDLGNIGDTNETLLSAALAHISGATGKLSDLKSKAIPSLQSFKDSNSFETFNNQMYTDKTIPDYLLKTTKFE